MRYELGSFELIGDKLIISDPCYEKDIGSDLQGVVKNCEPGTWLASVCVGRDLVVSLKAWKEETEPTSWEEADFEIGVDSGQAGIFDYSVYPQDPGEYNEGDSFYRKACDTTETSENHLVPAGMMEEGAVSSSGVGDGCYLATVGYLNGKVVEVEITFLEDADSEDEKYDVDEDEDWSEDLD